VLWWLSKWCCQTTLTRLSLPLLITMTMINTHHGRAVQKTQTGMKLQLNCGQANASTKNVWCRQCPWSHHFKARAHQQNPYWEVSYMQQRLCHFQEWWARLTSSHFPIRRLDSDTVEEQKKNALPRHETFHKRLKELKCLKETFTDGNNKEQPQFDAVVAIPMCEHGSAIGTTSLRRTKHTAQPEMG